ncbi:recombination protein RecR [Candidatus Uhrbacteria bacterium]|nr:recombination protein RecR [Candidatus Uhrbacteria bacterium]
MSAIPKPIHDAAAAFDTLPGVGPRAALRYAYWLASQHKDTIKHFARSIESVANGVMHCEICGLWSSTQICSICSDSKRDIGVICVVGTSQDARVIEESGAFRGTYHVLGGLLDPIGGRLPENLTISNLVKRVFNPQKLVREVILAVDPDVSGDMTAHYISKQLHGSSVTISRLARGLQHGAQIEYADGTTISDALGNRRDLSLS